METKKLQTYFFIGLLVIALALTVFIFKPFLSSVAIAFMIALLVRPVYRKILKTFKGRRSLSSLITIFFALIVILVPLSLLIQQLTIESFNLYSVVQSGQIEWFEGINTHIVKPIQTIVPSFNPDIEGYLQAFVDGLVGNIGGLFSSTASIGLSLLMIVIALFYILRDGHVFKKSLVELSPLSDGYDEQIIDKIERAINSVVNGSLFTSLIKGVLAAIGFALFGIPNIVIWGSLTAIVSLLPGIGAGLTIIPAVIYLLLTGSTGAAIGLAIWGTIFVGLIDNLLMPYIVGKGFTVHPLFVMLSVLGGIVVFGPIGLLLGPLILAFLSALIEIYKLLILDDKQKKTTTL